MLYTRTAIEYRDATLGVIVPAAVAIDSRVDDFSERRDRLAAERAIDDVLADGRLAHHASGHTPLTVAGERGTRLSDVVDVSRPTRGGRTFLQGLASLAGAVGIGLAVPFVILLIGSPVAVAARDLLEAVGWVLRVTTR